jgi:hypothetical protein
MPAGKIDEQRIKDLDIDVRQFLGCLQEKLLSFLGREERRLFPQRLVSQEEVTKQAERAAEEIVEDANARAREIRLGAEDYADEILNTLEINLQKFLAAVQRGRDRLAGREQEPAEVG